MSVRVFDGFDDIVNFLIGGCSSTGTWTLVALVKFDAGVGWQSLLSLEIAATGSELALGRSGSSGQVAAFRGGGAGGIADAVSVSSTDGWVLVAATKAASGSQPVTLHKGIVGGAWTHTAAESMGNVSAQQSIKFGVIDGADYFKGKAAAIAKWNTGLSNANLEALLTTLTRAGWLALSPAGLWDSYDSFATDHTGNGATGTVSGTTADAVDMPTGWASWAGGGGGVLVEGAASLDLTAAIAVAARRGRHGASATPLTASIAAAGHRRANGSFALPTALAIGTAGHRGAKAAADLALSLPIVTAGRRGLKGAADLALTLARDTAGQRRALSSAASALAFGAATAAHRTARGAVSLPLTLTASVRGVAGTVIEGAADLVVSFGASVTARRRARAAAALPLTLDVATDSRRTAIGRVALDVALGAVTAARKSTNGAAALVVTLAVAVEGRIGAVATAGRATRTGIRLAQSGLRRVGLSTGRRGITRDGNGRNGVEL